MKVKTIKRTVDVQDYIEQYVNVEEFLEKCKECDNYNGKWSCPTFDFSPLDYWSKYRSLMVVGKQIHLDEADKANMKKQGKPCKYPEQMRYSIEALGGNVGATAGKLLGIELQWIEQGQVPDYFALVGGLLYGNITNPV